MILKGDCIKVMKAMKSNSMDAIVTDPPYGLEFMGKEWDRLWDKREFGKTEYSKKSFTCSDGSTRKTNPVTRNLQNPNYKAGLEAQLWHTQWLTEANRVLKPGGSMLVMGGTRTSHRLACAIEDSGFIIKDTLMWIYGSGFPKAQDLGKMIDKRMGKERTSINQGSDSGIRKPRAMSPGGSKRNAVQTISLPSTNLTKHWDGFKVGGIKPAYEPIIWAVKSPEGSYIDNVLKWGVGAVNVDATRIQGQPHHNEMGRPSGENSFTGKGEPTHTPNKGRFPANVILSHHPECVQVGMKRVKTAWSGKGESKSLIWNTGGPNKNFKHTNPDDIETVESWDCHPDCAVRLLDEQSGDRKSKWGNQKQSGKGKTSIFGIGQIGNANNFIGDSGGASRFFKQCNYGQEEWLCHENCALRQLDEQSGILKSGANPEKRNSAKTKTCYGEFEGQKNCISYRGQNSGGASRFLYCAKASRGERNAGLGDLPDKLHGQSGGATQAPKEGKTEYLQEGHIGLNKIKIVKNNHPTVKPIKLFEWLVKLVTREGQIILDPFIGSGTTGIAAHNAGRKCIGIEKEEEYIEIAKRRVTHWRSLPKQLEII